MASMARYKRFTATGTGAVSLATSGITGPFRLISATIKFSAIPTTSERATLTLDANEGADYDAVLASADPSTGTGSGDVAFVGTEGDEYENDNLTLAYTNTDGRTFGAQIVVEPLGNA